MTQDKDKLDSYSNSLLPTNFPTTLQEASTGVFKPVKTKFVVTLRSSTVRADEVRRMRVRQGKAGPNGKKNAGMDMLARAEVKYSFGKIEAMVKNTNFGKYGEVMIDPKATVKVEDKPKVYKDINGKAFEYTEHINVVKRLLKVESVSFADEEILTTVNRLLRQVLLFKGVSFAEVEEKVKTTGKPVAFVCNTAIEIDPLRTHKAEDIRVFKVHKLIVKKTFREIQNVMGQTEEVCKIFFDGNSCKPINNWLKSLKFEI